MSNLAKFSYGDTKKYNEKHVYIFIYAPSENLMRFFFRAHIWSKSSRMDKTPTSEAQAGQITKQYDAPLKSID